MIHQLDDILRARVLTIACGYEDADDHDALRNYLGFRLALGKLPGSGARLASRPTMSRWGNAPTTSELARITSIGRDMAQPGKTRHRGLENVERTIAALEHWRYAR